MRRVDLPAAVDARFEPDGRSHVRGFSWQGLYHVVTTTGRTWVDDAGRHVLVMDSGDRVFELLLRRSDLNWRLVGVPPGESLA